MNGRRNEVFFLLWHCCCHQLSVNKSFNSAGWIVLTMFGLLMTTILCFQWAYRVDGWFAAVRVSVPTFGRFRGSYSVL